MKFLNELGRQLGFNKGNSQEVTPQQIDVMIDELKQSSGKATYSSEIEQVHHEFETASDRVLEEALCTLKEAESKSVEKGKRLLALGFKQAREATQAAEIEQSVKMATEVAELVTYYKKNYPFNKFITESQVKQICDKYNLVLGDIERYKGFVPEKQVKQIENFELKPKEKNCLIGRLRDGKQIVMENARIRRRKDYEHIYLRSSIDLYADCAFQRNVGNDGEFYARDSSNIFGLAHLGDLHFTIESDSFKICAPLKDMDTTNMTVNHYRLEKEIPDPVVLQSVKGGYLLVCDPWGDEASDPIVQNEINN